MSRSVLVCPLLMGAWLCVCAPAHAQTEDGTTPPPPPQETTAPVAKQPEIDQTLVNTQTTLPLKSGRGYFRLTHRFARDLFRDSFGGLLDDFFSLDNGAVVGLEFRWGLTSTLQAGVHRTTLGKTLQTFGRWDALRQSARSPLGLS